jgi:hypothetical protein
LNYFSWAEWFPSLLPIIPLGAVQLCFW